MLFDSGNPMGAPALHDAVRQWSPTRSAPSSSRTGTSTTCSAWGPSTPRTRPRPTVVAQELIGDRFDRYVLTNGYNAVINQRQFQAPNLTWPTEYRRPDVDLPRRA